MLLCVIKAKRKIKKGKEHKVCPHVTFIGRLRETYEKRDWIAYVVYKSFSVEYTCLWTDISCHFALHINTYTCIHLLSFTTSTIICCIIFNHDGYTLFTPTLTIELTVYLQRQTCIHTSTSLFSHVQQLTLLCYHNKNVD